MYSETVDKVIARCNRYDKMSDIISYVNQTMLECQSFKQSAFLNDLREDSAIVTATPFIWTKPFGFKQFRTVQYQPTNNQPTSAFNCYEPIYPKLVGPGKRQANEIYYYYTADNYYVFNGVAINDIINFAYYVRFPRLQYFNVGVRPATYNQFDGTWIYLNNITDPIAQNYAQSQVSNWLLQDYNELVTEGALSKVLKQMADNRSSSSFALYKSLQNDMLANEVVGTTLT